MLLYPPATMGDPSFADLFGMGLADSGGGTTLAVDNLRYPAATMGDASFLALFGPDDSTDLPGNFVIVSGSRLPNDSSAIVGGTAYLRHLETSTDGVTTFTIANPTVSILQPDNSFYGGSVGIQTIPGFTSLTQELRAIWTPSQGGDHLVKWSFSINGITIDRVETYFVAWTDVASTVRRRLRESSTSLPDVDIDAEVAVTVRQLIDRFTSLQQAGGYAGLVGLDQERFDTATAYMTALRMRMYRAKVVPIGELTGIKMNNTDFRYTSLVAPGQLSIEQEWMNEALLSLGRVRLVQQDYASAAASWSPFTISGPTRTNIANGQVQTLLTNVLQSLSDTWDTAPNAMDLASSQQI